jgi:hypothetical protein
MKDVIECLIAWLDYKPGTSKANRILRALANESLQKAELDLTGSQRRFDSLDLAVAAGEKVKNPKNEADDGTLKNTTDATEWIDWSRTVQKYWKTREFEIIDFARKRNLTHYPKPIRISTDGGPDPVTYQLIAELIPSANSNQDQSTDTGSGATGKRLVEYDQSANANGEIRLSWIARFWFPEAQIKLKTWLVRTIIAILIVIWLSSVLFAYFAFLSLLVPNPVTTHTLITLLSIIIVPYSVWFWLIKPCGRLFDERIVISPDWLVGFHEDSTQLELYKDDDRRMIRLVRYSAPCPICGATLNLDRGEPDYPHRLVGRCYDSPREHIVSFDPATKKGVILRGEALLT